jgi:hypothetical protein
MRHPFLNRIKKFIFHFRYPGQNMASQYGGNFPPNDPRGPRLQQIIERYEMSQAVAARLRTLENCEVVILVDDSGSMNMPLQGTNQTRWDEMRNVSPFI